MPRYCVRLSNKHVRLPAIGPVPANQAVMPVHNSDIAGIFDQTADILEIEGENPFRVRAYRNAARVVGGWPADLAGLVKHGDELPKLPGLGKDLTEKVEEIAQTGHLPLLDDLKRRVPETLLDLMKLPGLGPKRVRTLQDALNINSLADLKRAIRTGVIRTLRGFGPKIESKILEVLDREQQAQKRVKLNIAEQIAQSILGYLGDSKGIIRKSVAGSYRRRRETVGDLDLLVSAKPGSDVMKRFIDYDDVTEVLAHGETKSTVVLRSGLQVDLRVVEDDSFGAAMHYFTGSKSHNIAIRAMGVKRGLKINEYGVFKGNRRIGGRLEQDVFKSVELPYIEPELRENGGEIEAAQKGTLPKLVTLEQIRGDLHAHTTETDGRMNLEQMAEAAERMGYEYLAITDHSRHLSVARGLTPVRLKSQIRKIDKFNEQSKGIKLLKAIEVDILADGSLDLPDEVLALLDLTVCSIHSHFDLPAAKQTQRILRAMENRHFHILGHPTGRLIGQRDAYGIDIERIIKAAREYGCFLELNAQPDRMDLASNYCKLAKELGVRVVISTDAHSEADLHYMKFGVSQARRGWLEPDDVLNTRSFTALQKLLRR